jgi:hypothetical protein
MTPEDLDAMLAVLSLTAEEVLKISGLEEQGGAYRKYTLYSPEGEPLGTCEYRNGEWAAL